jgi:hypothetical protein
VCVCVCVCVWYGEAYGVANMRGGCAYMWRICSFHPSPRVPSLGTWRRGAQGPRCTSPQEGTSHWPAPRSGSSEPSHQTQSLITHARDISSTPYPSHCNQPAVITQIIEGIMHGWPFHEPLRQSLAAVPGSGRPSMLCSVQYSISTQTSAIHLSYLSMQEKRFV